MVKGRLGPTLLNGFLLRREALVTESLHLPFTSEIIQGSLYQLIRLEGLRMSDALLIP